MGAGVDDADVEARATQRTRPHLCADVAPSRRTLAIAGAVVGIDVALFVLIAHDVVDGGRLVSHDEVVLDWFVDHRTDWSIQLAKLLGSIGKFVPLAIICVVVGIWLWRRGVKPMWAAAPLASLVLASLASTAAKSILDRERPPIALHATTAALAAFPSGHATDAAAFGLATGFTLALTTAHHSRSQALLVAAGLLFAALVGVSRLVLAVHWLSDVLAGWALGSSVAIATVATIWYLTTRRHDAIQHSARQ